MLLSDCTPGGKLCCWASLEVAVCDEAPGGLCALVEDIVLHKVASVDLEPEGTWLTQEGEEHKEHNEEELVVPMELESPNSLVVVDLEEDHRV